MDEYNITEYINEDCYDFYYKKPKDWNEYYENMEDEEEI